MWPSNPAPRYLWQEKWNFLFAQKSIEKVYSSFFHKHQKMETTQMSINRWLYKQTVLKSYNGILISNEKEWVTDKCNIINEFQMQYMLSESSQIEKASVF